MNMQDRISLTRTIWVALMFGIVAGMMFTAPLIGAWSLALVFMMMVAAIVVTGFVWQWGVPFASQGIAASSQEENEKLKRDRIEAVLRRLSDTQLQNLRERLASGELTDESLGDMLEDEVKNKQKRY